MLLSLIALAGALVLLTWSAELFVDGAAAAAARYRMPPLLAGLLTGGLVTAAPELSVAMLAALNGSPALALGTAWGSCIVHLSLLVGLSALVRPLRVRSRVPQIELALLLAAIGLSAVLAMDGTLGRMDALYLLLAFAALLGWALLSPRPANGTTPPTPKAAPRAAPLPGASAPALRRMALGAAILLASARLLVWAASDLAHWLGIGELALGLTVLAAGTALPALAACMALARRNAPDLVIGHAAGAGLFNVLAVAGMTALIAPVGIGSSALGRDLPAMAGLTLALLVLGGGGWRRTGGRLGRAGGALLVAAYLAYLLWVLRSPSATWG